VGSYSDRAREGVSSIDGFPGCQLRSSSFLLAIPLSRNLGDYSDE
jgi:hypothetical protein